jgi:hypothetical protein
MDLYPGYDYPLDLPPAGSNTSFQCLLSGNACFQTGFLLIRRVLYVVHLRVPELNVAL